MSKDGAAEAWAFRPRRNRVREDPVADDVFADMARGCAPCILGVG